MCLFEVTLLHLNAGLVAMVVVVIGGKVMCL